MKKIIHCKSCSDTMFIYVKYNGTECSIYKVFVDIKSLAPHQNPMYDLSLLTIGNDMASPSRCPGEKLPSTW